MGTLINIENITYMEAGPAETMSVHFVGDTEIVVSGKDVNKLAEFCDAR